jgi:hypothetical protein
MAVCRRRVLFWATQRESRSDAAQLVALGGGFLSGPWLPATLEERDGCVLPRVRGLFGTAFRDLKKTGMSFQKRCRDVLVRGPGQTTNAPLTAAFLSAEQFQEGRFVQNLDAELLRLRELRPGF